jgi:diguanylate cyclase (GGDEF)-like protein/PAS domain S-box-containing protein
MEAAVSFRLLLKDPPQFLSVRGDVQSLMGFRRDDFRSSRVTLPERVHRDDAEVLAVLLSSQLEPRAGSCNLRLRAANGDILCVQAQYTKEADPATGDVILALVLREARGIEESSDGLRIAGFRGLLERKQAEEALRRSEESLRQVEKIAGLCTYTLNIGTGTWEGSATLESVLGIGSTHPRTHDGWLAILHPDDRKRMSRELDLKIAGHVPSFDSEYRILRPSDGTVRWIKGMQRIEYSEEGTPVSLRGTLQDITESKLTELALRENQKLLQVFVEHAPVALAMFDRQMRYLSVSRRWAEDHQIDEHAMIGRSHYEINPNIPERWKETHRRGLAGEAQRVEEDRYDKPNGVSQWIRWQIIPWRDEDGVVGGIVMFYEDITARREAEARLRESKDLLQLFIDRAPAALAMFDRDMRYIAVSRRWLEDNALVGKDILGHCHYEVVPDIPERWKEAHRRGMSGETLRSEDERFDRADGVLWIRWEVVPWRAADGSVGGIVLFVEDITAQKKTEEGLRQAASVFTHAREGILITDQNGKILDVNEAFADITGYTRAEVLGKNPRVLKSGFQDADFYRGMWSSLRETGQWSGEIWNRAKGGDIYAEMLNISAVRDGNGEVLKYVALFSDVTELKNKQRQLEQMAHYDVLTGLPNRILLADRLRQAMAQARRRKQLVAVAYIDLDEFKQVNDSHGHVTGDQLLKVLAPRMRRSLRETDTLARLGGDEFVALLLDLPNTEAALPVLGRLLKASAQALEIGSQSLHVSASIGVAYYPQAEELDADQLLRRADQAMYQAKLAGKNRYHIFDPVQDVSVRGRYESLEQVRRALTQSQFVLHYQPIIHMRSGAIVGAEALLRLQHPERGLLPPEQFLRAIQDHPLEIAVGEWVIENALAQIEAWQALGLDILVSVNVSSSQLQDPGFVGRLRALLASHPRVKPSRLELEVLETCALRDLIQTSEVLEACNRMGIGIALDDFGTGYSSLTYLKRLPARILKIDRSFVVGMLENSEDKAIVEGVLSLAKAFDRQVIAEGVETAKHGLALLKMGCELAQGYGIARPMPAADFPGWVERWRPGWPGRLTDSDTVDEHTGFDPEEKKTVAASAPALYIPFDERTVSASK